MCFDGRSRRTHIAETPPFRFPLLRSPLENLDKLPEILLIPSNRLTDSVQLGLDLL